jgi:hypothetical protein
MSVGQIFSNLFGGAPAQPANPGPLGPTGVANPGQPLPGTQATPGTDNNGMVPAQQPGQNPGTPGTSDGTPFADFKDIWQTPNTPQDQNQALFANLDPAKVMESARKVDFAKNITAAQIQAIQAGGPDAVKAFAESMNQVAQTVYAQSAIATTKIVEQALSKQTERYDAQLPTMVKKYSTNESLLTENPLLSNPAIQPLVGALQEQLIRKNPNATSAEIQKQVSDYFAAMGTAFAPKAPETPQSRAAQRAAKSEDWDSFLS